MVTLTTLFRKLTIHRIVYTNQQMVLDPITVKDKFFTVVILYSALLATRKQPLIYRHI